MASAELLRRALEALRRWLAGGEAARWNAGEADCPPAMLAGPRFGA